MNNVLMTSCTARYHVLWSWPSKVEKGIFKSNTQKQGTLKNIIGSTLSTKLFIVEIASQGTTFGRRQIFFIS